MTSLLHWWHCMNSISDATRWLEMDGNYCTWGMLSSLAASDGFKKLLIYSKSCALPKHWKISGVRVFIHVWATPFLYIYISKVNTHYQKKALEDVCMIFWDAFGSFSYTYMFLPNQHRNPRLWVVRYPNVVGSLWHWKWRKDRTKPAGLVVVEGEKKQWSFPTWKRGGATWGWIYVQKMREVRWY